VLYFIVEVKSQTQGWTPVNFIQAQSGRQAIDLAEEVLGSMFPSYTFPLDSHRVRRVDHAKYTQEARNLLEARDTHNHWASRLAELESSDQVAALLDPRAL